MKKLLFICFSLLLFSAQAAQKDTCIVRIEKINDPDEQAKEYNLAAHNAWETGLFDKAVEYATKGIALTKENSEDRTHVLLLNNRGIANDYLGNYTEALNDYFSALRLVEKTDDPEMEAELYSNIGLVYSNQRLSDKAIDYHKRSLKIRKKLNDLRMISISLNNLAIAYYHQKKYEQAIENYKECIRIDKELEDIRGLSADYNNIGICYMDMRDHEQAMIYLKESLKIREELEDQLGIGEALNNIGTVLFNQARYEEARKYFLKSLPLSEALNSKESLKYTYSLLNQLEEKLGNAAAAYDYYKKFIVYRDSIENTDNARAQTELELQYQFDKEKEITRLEQEKKNEQFRLIIYAVSGGLILIIFFSMLLFRRWKQTQRQQKVIAAKNREITDSITYAKRIQNAILPSDAIVNETFPQSFVLYLPKDIVSGDFYWLEEQHGLHFFAVADCTGHGVPGAMMSVVCHNALNRSVREFKLKDPAQILDKTREIVISELSKSEQDVTDGMDISLCVIHKDKTKISWAGANNPLWIYRAEEQDIESFKPDSQPIGKHHHEQPFTSHDIKLHPGDRVYLFSDGYADQFGGEKGKKLMKSRFLKELVDSAQLPMDIQKEHLIIYFRDWKRDNEQLDDVCVACFGVI